MTDTAKFKKGQVGGDDVRSEDTERLQPGNEKCWRVGESVGKKMFKKNKMQ